MLFQAVDQLHSIALYGFRDKGRFIGLYDCAKIEVDGIVGIIVMLVAVAVICSRLLCEGLSIT